jgi:hypothetical protein
MQHLALRRSHLRVFLGSVEVSTLPEGEVLLQALRTPTRLVADHQHKQHRRHKPDYYPDRICWVLPSMFDNTGDACRESSNENDN